MVLTEAAFAVNPVGCAGTVVQVVVDAEADRVVALTCDEAAELPAASTASTT
jgi:hypothetical protein